MATTVAQLEKRIRKYQQQLVSEMRTLHDRSKALDQKMDVYLTKATASKFTYLYVAVALGAAFFIGTWVG